MLSIGKRWKCPNPDCGKTVVKNPKPRGGYRQGKKGGTPVKERVRKCRERAKLKRLKQLCKEPDLQPGDHAEPENLVKVQPLLED